MFDQPDIAISERAASLVPKDAHLYRHLPYLTHYNDHVIRTRENAFFRSFEIEGVDGLSASEADILALRNQFATVLASLNDNYTIHVHRMMRPARIKLHPLTGDRFEADIERHWHAHLQSTGTHEFVIVVTVLRHNRAPIKVPFFRKSAAKLLGANDLARVNDVNELTSILQSTLSAQCRDLSVSNGSLLGFLASLISGDHGLIERNPAVLVAEDISNVSVKFQNDCALIEGGVERQKYAACLSIKAPSQTTYAGFLDRLDASLGTIISHSFTPIENQKITERAKLRIEQMKASQDLAGTVLDQLHEAYDAVESGGLGFGDHQLTVTLYAPTKQALEEKVASVRGIASQSSIKLLRETIGLEATFFAVHPGNDDYRMRAMTLSSLNFADMASFHTNDHGNRSEVLPWRTPITVLKSVSGTAHKFSFHEAGDPKGEPTNGHTLVLGPSGSGKTVAMAFLAAQARRTGARLFIFDKERGLEMATRAMGGTYAAIKAGENTGLNPLMSEDGPRGEAWALGWLSALVEANDGALTPKQSEALKSAVRQNGQAAPNLRNFDAFTSLIGDVGDGGQMRDRIAEWATGGRYDWVFGAAKDTLVDFADNPVTAIDLTEILDMPVERMAVLSYLFRRIELLFEEKKPTIVIIDEAWRVLDDPYFSKRLANWLVTARKQNVVVAMLTQFPSQIRQSHSASTLMEALPNQILFPNHKAEAPDYEGFGLTESELGFLLAGRGAERQALLRAHGKSTFIDFDLSPLGPCLTALGGGRAGGLSFGEDYKDTPFFWRQT